MARAVSRTPLKILHVLDHSLPLSSGYAFRTHSILRAQIKRGWRPVGLTAPVADRGQPQSPEGTIDGCRYYRTPPIPAVPSFVGALYRRMAALRRRLREVADIERPDVLHVHSPAMNAYPAFHLERSRGLPTVYEQRTLWEEAAVAHGTYRRGSWRYRLMRGLETRACRRAWAVAVLSQGLRNDLIRRGVSPATISVAGNGVDVDRFRPSDPDPAYRAAWALDGKRVIAFIGSFSGYEGLDLLLDAMARIARARSDVVLLLVGGGRVDRELRAHAARLSLEDRVIMPGRLPQGRLPGVYALADALIYPRRALRLTELVTPLKPLEAMAMGRALVASDVGGHRELIQPGRTGLLVPPGDATRLAETVQALLDDRELRETLGRQGTRWVRETRTWDQTTAVYADVYARALERARG